MKGFHILFIINDFNRFKYNKTKNKDKKHFCMNWLQGFSSLDVLENHQETCLDINEVLKCLEK